MFIRIRYENIIFGGSILMGSILVCEICCVIEIIMKFLLYLLLF